MVGARRSRPWDILAAIAAGGAIGGLLRRAVNLAVPATAGDFPWPTFLENVSGTLLLAMLLVYVTEVRPPSRYLRPFLGVGVLGSFTTFSALTNETRALLLGGRAGLAFGYVAVTLAAGLAAAWTGMRLARRLAGAAGASSAASS
jgi:fluoride exporter